jgi:hypothetical protein
MSLALALCVIGAAEAQTPLPPEQVDVLPVFLVPQGQPLPSPQQEADLMAHVRWSQQRFHEMLGCRSTFAIAGDAPHVYPAVHTIEFYQQQPELGAPLWTSELLDHYGHDRFTNPYIFLIVVMNPTTDYPPGGGRPCNGGFNTGGGIVIMSSYALDHHPHFQSTLQHELGHAFGLPHVDVYGYDMQTNDSIMSYNPAHHTHGFEPSATPGILIPEDIRGLAYNDRALPRLAFDPDVDVPPGYEPAPPVWLGPMSIPGQVENAVLASTPSGEAYGTSIENVVQGWIMPSAGPGITFDPATMWCSEISETGWVTIELLFPLPVELDRMTIHSQHSGAYHAAEHARILAWIDGADVLVADQALESVDAEVDFAAAVSDQWTLHLEAGRSRRVVVRGLQFHLGDAEVFPPFIPEPVTGACRWDLDGSGDVDIGDFLILLASWGVAPVASGDFDCDGSVGVTDFLTLLAQWASCGGSQ